MAETKWCPRCEQEVPISEWYRNTGRRDGLSSYCRPCYAALNEDLRRRDRAALIEAMGGQCERCGFADFRALQVDHIDGGGHTETRYRHGKKWTAHVLANRDDFALLCANCNVIKRIENAEHVGERDYGRVPPSERVVRPSRRWTPEQRAAQSEKSKRLFEDAEFRAKFYGAPNPRRSGKPDE